MGAFRTDPSITARGVSRPFDPIAAFSRIANLRRLQQRGQINQLQLEDMERERARQKAIRGAVGAGGTRADILARLQEVAPLAGLKFGAEFSAQGAAAEKAKLAQRKGQLENAKATAELMGQLAGPIRAAEENEASPASPEALQVMYANALAQLPPEVAAKLPQQYEPGMARQAMLEAVSVKDQIDQALRQAELDEKIAAREAGKLLSPEEEAQRIRIAKARGSGGLATISTVDDQGRAVTRFVPKELGGEFLKPPTADMRNKVAARKTLVPAIDALEALSKKVITEKLAIAQKAVAAGRTVEAALADDPEFRTYQDARLALAGNLAVAQQGSRPSDADVKAIWLPLVPNVFKDTIASARMKWNLIRINSGLPSGAPQEGDRREHEGAIYEFDGTIWVKQ